MLLQLFSADHWIIHNQAACEAAGDVVHVITPAERWAYALEFPRQASEATPCNHSKLKVRVRIYEGVIGVGLLAARGTEYINEFEVAASGDSKVIEFPLPEYAEFGSLIVRNRSANGSSTAEVEILGSITEFSPARVSRLADQILAMAKALARAAADNPAPPTFISQVTAVAEELRPFLGQGNLALIHAQPLAMEAVFAGLDIHALSVLADHLKAIRPIGPEGGWHFSKFASRPDLATLVRYALWNTLHNLTERPSLTIPWHAGTTFMMHFDNDLSLVLYVDGSFEPNEFSFLDGLLKPGMRVIDAGANEGAYTVFLASKVGPTGRVIAIEPSSRERERLQANIANNKLANVAVVPSALADRAGQASLKIAEAIHAGQNTIKEFVHTAVRSAGTEIVSTVTLDQLVAAERLEEVDVIKLDIEGAEMLALAGAKNMLRHAKPLLLLEGSPPSLAGETDSVAEFLVRENYHLLCFNRTTGLLEPYSDGPFSDNFVAVHRKRDWGLLPPKSPRSWN